MGNKTTCLEGQVTRGPRELHGGYKAAFPRRKYLQANKSVRGSGRGHSRLDAPTVLSSGLHGTSCRKGGRRGLPGSEESLRLERMRIRDNEKNGEMKCKGPERWRKVCKSV